jgi:hypothetical protein
MAKNLTFTIKGTDYAVAPVKIERKKLYGWTELIALDDDGELCSSVTVDETGSVIIPKGGIGMGILSPLSQWVDRSSLKAVDAGGKDVPLFPSSYDQPVILDKEVSAERFLDYTITALYQMDDGAELAKALGSGIFTFSFNPRSDYEGSDAFLLAQGDTVFMLTGYEPGFEFIGLEEAELVEESDDEVEEEEDGDIDFAMF